MFFLCYSLTCHENPLEIFPYGDPLPTGKLGKLTHLPPPLENPIPSVGGGYGYFLEPQIRTSAVSSSYLTRCRLTGKFYLPYNLSSLNVCLGFSLKESERVRTMVPHRTGVLESMTDGLQGKKVCAQNCLVHRIHAKIVYECRK